MEIISSEAKNEDATKENPSPLRYSCKYCEKKFSTRQALGGHQNGHKFVRALSKSKGVGMGNAIPGFGYQARHLPLYSYPRIGTFPRQTYSYMMGQGPYTAPFGMGHSYQAGNMPKAKDYDVGRNWSLAPVYTTTGDSSSSIPSKGVSDLLGGGDSMAKQDDSSKEDGNTELDITLRL